MLIQTIEISKIQPYDRNPRRNDNAVETVVRSIREFGFQQPIVVDKNMTIVVGHTRYRAAKSLGMKQVPVVIADTLNDDQIRAYRIMDNRSNQNAEWDNELLTSEFKELEKSIDLLLTGFTAEEIRYLQDEDLKTPDEKENEIPDLETEKVRTKLGDVWTMGDHRLVCGSATSVNDWQMLMQDRTADVIFTSPPYNMGGNLYDEYSDDKGSEEYIDFNDQVVSRCLEHLKGFLFYNISYNKNSRTEFIDVLYNIKKRIRFLELIVWRKNSAMPITATSMLTRMYEDIGVFASDDVWEDIEFFTCHTTEKEYAFNKKTKNKITNVWEIDNKNVQEDNHKAAFPVELPGRGIRLCSKPGAIIVDPFGGTGTTLIAAEKYNRCARLIELSPVYCDLIIRRWQKYSLGKAVRQDGILFDGI
jgi:DNA modification methylase